jgi:8-amino-7-oxononanoate synthase
MHFAASMDFLGGRFGNGFSQILPVLIGDDGEAVRLSESLQAVGFDVRAIRPPTVPEGTARLRVSLSTNITEKNLRDFSNALTMLQQKRAA